MLNTNFESDNFPVRGKLRKNRTFQDFVDGITLTAIAALLIVIVMLYITTISFSTDFSLKQIGYEGIILYAATVSISLLARKYSRRKGKGTQAYLKAATRVEEYNHIIINSGFSSKTSAYCRNWESKELASTRTALLSSAGISLSDFETKYLKYNKRELKSHFPDLSEYELQTILRTKKIKRLKYDEKYLTASDAISGRHSPSGGFTVRMADKVNMVQTFITAAISGLFSASLIIEVVANPSWATIITCAAKLIMIVIFGVFNIIGGYNMSAVKEVRELNEKADEQARFVHWCEQDNSEKLKEKAAEKLTAAEGVIV